MKQSIQREKTITKIQSATRISNRDGRDWWPEQIDGRAEGDIDANRDCCCCCSCESLAIMKDKIAYREILDECALFEMIFRKNRRSAYRCWCGWRLPICKLDSEKKKRPIKTIQPLATRKCNGPTNQHEKQNDSTKRYIFSVLTDRAKHNRRSRSRMCALCLGRAAFAAAKSAPKLACRYIHHRRLMQLIDWGGFLFQNKP